DIRRPFHEAAGGLSRLHAPGRLGDCAAREPGDRVTCRTEPAHVDRLHRPRPGSDVSRRQSRGQFQPMGAGRLAAADPMDFHRQPGFLKGGPMRHTAMVVLVGLVAAGCDLFNNALQVQTPSNIPAGSLEVPANAGLLVNSAIGDFECAAGAYAVMSGLITDELKDATQTADRYPYELRTMLSSDRRYAVNDCVALGVYTPLQTARFSSANVLSLLNGWTVAQVPARDSLIATASAYEGYSLVLLGEGFCTMVVSGLDANRQIVYGGEISRDSVFKLAVVAFSDAIAGGNADIVNMARVGRARAYLDLGQPALARADAQLVPAAYLKVVSASGINSRRNNRVWQENSATSDNTSLDAVYRAMADPRVPFADKGKNSVTGIHLYRQLKDTSAGTSIRLASGDEARLINAEAYIRMG